MAQQDERTAHLRNTFATDGYLCLPRALPREQVQQWSERYASGPFFRRIFEQLHKHGHTPFPTHRRSRSSSLSSINDENNTDGDTDRSLTEFAMGQGVKHGFREIVMRSPARYEIAVTDDHCEAILEVIKDRLPFVPELLCPANPSSNDALLLTWKDVKIVNLSVVVSTPGAPEQAWHADGGHVNLQEHVPCHCLNIFVPLTTVTAESGPTELRPGTHYHTRHLTKFMLAAKARKSLRPPVAPTMEPGDCLIFDYRILHRGKANHHHLVALDDDQNGDDVDHIHNNNNRTILVVAVAQPWFKDVVNFPQRSLDDPPTT